MSKIKHYFVCLEITDGEHGYYSNSVYQSTLSIEKVCDKAMKTWYDNEKPIKLKDGGYEYPYSCVIVKTERAEEISESDYNVLKTYI